MSAKLRKLVDDNRFQNFITAIIILAGVVVGMETSQTLMALYGSPLHILNDIILWIFVVEAVIKIGAEGRRPWRYFMDPWNVFDFMIVAICFMPVNAQYVAVLRLARLLRVLKLVRALPRLQILVSALLKSIPSMGYVALLLGMLFYVYSVAAVFLFGGNDPVHFSNLAIAMLSLFRVVTGEDWTDVMYIQMWGCDQYGYEGMMELCTQPMSYPVFGALFFVSFMLLGAMVILNLFIGVIMGGMDEAERENKLASLIARRDIGKTKPSDDFAVVLTKLEEIQEELTLLQAKIELSDS